MKSSASNKVVIDRTEGDLAVVVLFDDDRVRFNLPSRYLPDGVKEGDHLQMSFTEDEASRHSEQKRVDDLLKELKNK
jgi:Protein of unknown function (DUF3006)